MTDYGNEPEDDEPWEVGYDRPEGVAVLSDGEDELLPPPAEDAQHCDGEAAQALTPLAPIHCM